jgi:DNA repair protein RadC
LGAAEPRYALQSPELVENCVGLYVPLLEFNHFGSLAVLAQASVEQLVAFISRSKAIRLVSSLRMGAVTLREERQSITIDSPEIVAELCSEMRFLDRELLRVVLLNAKQHLIKVVRPSAKALSTRVSLILARSLNL